MSHASEHIDIVRLQRVTELVENNWREKKDKFVNYCHVVCEP